MPVPTHRASCQTWIYPTDCRYCGAGIHVLQCTCGSAVLLDTNRPPWDEHDCSTTGTLGRSGLKGWAAIDVLRSAGVPISPDIMSKVFDSPTPKRSSAGTKPSIKAIKPKNGHKIGILALVSDLITRTTKKTDVLDDLGGIGSKVLQLPKGKLWQATLVVNSEQPNLSYTCVLPADLGLPKDAKNKMVFAQLQGKASGGYALWLITEIALI